MEESRCHRRTCTLVLYLFLAATICCTNHCDARKFVHVFRNHRHPRSANTNPATEISMLMRFGIDTPPILLDSSNSKPYVSSPISLTPYESLSPLCVNPPITQGPPPSTTVPNPIGGYTPSPLPPSTSAPALPGGDNPPPAPICTTLTPPTILPNPPNYTPTPTIIFPSPPDFVPGPTMFLPPIVYPPPAVPPPPHTAPTTALWCVAKPSVPEPIIQEAMNYACAYGAGCDPIIPNGSCFHPDTVLAHASYAFNSYWQQTKVGGGTCEFGGTAMLVTEDPSYDGCHFIYY